MVICIICCLKGIRYVWILLLQRQCYICTLFQYAVLLLAVFILEAGSGVLTYLYELNVSFTFLYYIE